MLGLVSSGVTYYTLYILEDMNYVGPILMANLIPTILMMFVMPFLIERFGRRKVFAAGLVISITGLTGFGLCAPSITPMLMFYVLFGVGNGLHKGTLVVMIADMVVYTEKTTGQFKAGTGNAGLSASEKLGGGLSSIVFGSLLGAAGFNAALKVQPAAVGSMISMLFIWLPVLLLAVAFVIFILFYNFERKNDNENGHSSAG
jgi:GPH family glycoside/pentoside/hexuronide:cation symporter